MFTQPLATVRGMLLLLLACLVFSEIIAPQCRMQTMEDNNFKQ